MTAEGCIISWPKPAQGLYGYDPSTVLGQQLTAIFSEETAADTAITELLDTVAEGAYEATGKHRRADGSEFWAALTLTPLRNEELYGYAVVSQDQTAERQERERLERQNDRLKEFTDILAHDLRSPLAVIEGELELYQETGDRPHLETISNTTVRMEALVDDLLQVARHGSAVTNPGQIDIEDVIETAWAGTGANSTDATVQTEPFGPIQADADRLVQLFENLFRNAVEHGGDAVTVHVGPLDAGFFVEDDGTGIADEVRDRVFDHGVTTSGEGTGYGLSIARTIANAHGWDVAVTEAATGGARFEFTGVENLRGEGGATSHEETRPE